MRTRTLPIMMLGMLVLLGMLALPASGSNWTAMIYLDGDNNLEYYAGVEMKEVNASDADIDVLVLKDDWRTSDTHLYHVRNGTTTRLYPSWLGREANMGDGDTLAAFVNWSLSTYPANHSLLTLWDHGGSFVGCCVDSTNGSDILRIPEIRSALEDALGDGGRIDVLGFADCLMSSVEVASEMAPVADYMVGSEKVGWAYATEGINWDFDDIIDYMVNRTPSEVAAYIVQNAMDLVPGMKYQSHTWSAMDLGIMDNLTESIDALAEALTDAFADHHMDIIRARMATESYEGPYGGWYDRIIDLYHLAENLRNKPGLSGEIHNLSADLMDTVNATIIAEDHHTAWNGFDEPCDHAHGLSIHFPDVRWKRWAYYNTSMGAVRFNDLVSWVPFLDEYGRFIFVDDDTTGAGEGSLGSPYADLDLALDNATAGDVLIVHNGTYDGGLTVDVRIEIRGNATAGVTIDGSGTSRVLVVSAAGTVMSNLTVEDGSGDPGAGIEIAADGVTLSHVRCRDSAVGVLVNASDDVTLSWCTLTDDTRALEVRGNGSGLTVRNTTLANATWDLYVAGPGDVDARYCRWAGLNESGIRSAIHDRDDDMAAGKVRYSPWYGAGNVLEHGDDTPPMTTDDADLLWHRTSVTVSLAATDDDTGVDATYYRIDGGSWVEGSSPVVVAHTDHSGDGEHTVEYYSVDANGNREAVLTAVVRIDTRPPELRIVYDVASGKFRLLPIDLLDTSPVKTSRRSGQLRIITLTDHAGNVAKIRLYRSRTSRNGWDIQRVCLDRIRYNGGAWTAFSGERFAVRTRSSGGLLIELREMAVGATWRVDGTYTSSSGTTTFGVQDGGWSTVERGSAVSVEMRTDDGSATYILP